MMNYIKDVFNTVCGYLGLYTKKANLLFLGLDDAGKSTLLYMLKTDKMTQLKPTIQPHSEELKLGNIRFNTFDLGGHETARKIWKDYFPSVDGIIFLVDSSNSKRFPEAKEELENLANTPELLNIPICILGNKVDKENAVNEEELKEALDLTTIMLKESRPMQLFMCSVSKKIGYGNALNWMTNYLK